MEASIDSGLARRIAGSGYALLAIGSIWGGITMIGDGSGRVDMGIGVACFCFAVGCAVASLRRLQGRRASLAAGFPLAVIGGTLAIGLMAGEIANIRAGHPLGDWHDSWKPLTLVMAFWAITPLVRRVRARTRA